MRHYSPAHFGRAFLLREFFLKIFSEILDKYNKAYYICTINHTKQYTMKNAIGQLQTKSTAYCTVCSCSTRRHIKALVYENTPQEIERARKEVTKKINKPYTCRICASIVRDVIQAEEAEAQNA